MSHLKKLLFTKKFSDYEGYKWTFSVYKAIAWCIVILVISVILYGYFVVENSKEFFGNVLFYAIVISISLIILLLVSGTIKKFRTLMVRFFLIIVIITFLYAIFGMIFAKYTNINFYVGYSTWILLTVLAGWGAKNDKVFNGNLDRHDVFYSLVVFVTMVGANFPITSNGGFLQNLDILVKKVLSLLPLFSDLIGKIPAGNTTKVAGFPKTFKF